MPSVSPGTLDPESGIYFESLGEAGPPIVLLHPIGLDLHTWDAVTPLLPGCRLFALDLPGHGASSKPDDADYSIPGLAAVVLKWLVSIGLDSAVFVGNSLGGGVALAVAEAAPERVAGLGLLDTVAYRDSLHFIGRTAFLPGLEWLLGRTPLAAVHHSLRMARSGRRAPSAATSHRCHAYLHCAAGRRAFFRTLRALYGTSLPAMESGYAHIQSPTLIVHGAEDPLISPRYARRLAAAIPGADPRILQGCGHFPQEERPEETAEALRSLITRI